MGRAEWWQCLPAQACEADLSLHTGPILEAGSFFSFLFSEELHKYSAGRFIGTSSSWAGDLQTTEVVLCKLIYLSY